jgi:hypothetical protein
MRIQVTNDDTAGPSVKPIDDAGRRADLPAEGDQDCSRNQKPGDHDGKGNAHGEVPYCPFCGGPLTEAAAIRTYEQLRDTDRRWRAGELSVRVPAKARHAPVIAKHFGRDAPPLPEDQQGRRQLESRSTCPLPPKG